MNINKYFGTDGFRGEANAELTSLHAYKVGRFLGWYFSSPLSGCKEINYKPRIVIGKDTRRSSYMLEYSIVAGITASGADAYLLHVTTTPSVSFVVRQDGFDCGIMITASHNPYYDNGIKIINKYGEKLDEQITEMVESYIDGDLTVFNVKGNDIPLAKRDKIGAIVDYIAGRNRYIGYLISVASHSYRDLRIGLDCANGASWSLAKAVFDALGAQTFITGASPNGININEKCGSTHIENLIRLVTDNSLDIGFAFDGDADRCIAIDENGNVIDGDKILYILAKRLKSAGMLQNDTVVVTIMSNLGLIDSLKKDGIHTETTAVGDRYVYQKMSEGGYQLGGEQSGHIIIKKFATTGDGILTAIVLTEDMKDRKLAASKLSEGLVTYPQITESFNIESKNDACNDKDIVNKVNELEGKFNCGRIVLRASGTEPVVRLMVEAPTYEICLDIIAGIKELFIKKGYIK